MRVAAVAVNTVDTLVRSGAWHTPVAFPLVVGRDLAGTVAAVGAGVSDVRPGDRVWASSAGYGGRPGAAAGLVRVAPERLYRLPDGADPLAFVAAVHPGATAYGVLTGRARVQPGETVAVIGGNGAVGMCLIQVAAAHGAHPIAVVRDGRTESALGELGAQQVAVAAAAAGGLAAAAAAAPGGVDVVVDTTGRAALSQAPDLVNLRGRIVVIAGTRRRIAMTPQWRGRVGAARAVLSSTLRNRHPANLTRRSRPTGRLPRCRDGGPRATPYGRYARAFPCHPDHGQPRLLGREGRGRGCRQLRSVISLRAVSARTGIYTGIRRVRGGDNLHRRAGVPGPPYLACKRLAIANTVIMAGPDLLGLAAAAVTPARQAPPALMPPSGERVAGIIRLVP